MPSFDMAFEEMKAYQGINPKPDDFDVYWKNALSELAAAGTDYEIRLADFQAPGAECYDMYFSGVGGSVIHCRLARPAAQTVKGPALVIFHGYSVKCSDFFMMLPYVMSGFTVASMDCRGQGGESQDLNIVRSTTYNGHIIRGLEDGPEHLYYRNVYLDTAQTARILMTMDNVDAARVGAHGGSQGGALTLACAALEPRIRFIATCAPFLCDFKRIWQLGLFQDAYKELDWYFRMRDPMHKREAEIFRTLGYIDIQYLAPRIQGDVLWILGLEDTVCPPSAQFAAYNHLKCRKEMNVYYEYKHEVFPGWVPDIADQVYSFIMKHS